MAMHLTHNEAVTGLWCLGFVILAIGLVVGHLYWPRGRFDGDWIDRIWQAGYDRGYDDSQGDNEPPSIEPPIYEARRTIVLDPGPTIYPELAALAEQAIDGPQIDADRPDTGTWMRTLRIKWESEYPIPGTPQWEARHPVGVS